MQMTIIPVDVANANEHIWRTIKLSDAFIVRKGTFNVYIVWEQKALGECKDMVLKSKEGRK